MKTMKIKLIPFLSRISLNNKKCNEKQHKIQIVKCLMWIVVNHSLTMFPSMIQMTNGYNRINNQSLSPLCHPTVKDQIFLLYFKQIIKM